MEGKSVLGLVGKKLAGKDTLADALVARYGAVKLGFIDLISEELAKLLEIPQDQILKLKEPYFRKPLQALGAKLRRINGADVWVTRMVHKILQQPDGARVVITGVRMLPEADALRTMADARLVRIRRANYEYEDQDITETEQDQIHADLVIVSHSAEATQTTWADKVAQFMGWGERTCHTCGWSEGAPDDCEHDGDCLEFSGWKPRNG